MAHLLGTKPARVQRHYDSKYIKTPKSIYMQFIETCATQSNYPSIYAIWRRGFDNSPLLILFSDIILTNKTVTSIQLPLGFSRLSKVHTKFT